MPDRDQCKGSRGGYTTVGKGDSEENRPGGAAVPTDNSASTGTTACLMGGRAHGAAAGGELVGPKGKGQTPGVCAAGTARPEAAEYGNLESAQQPT